jgi:hypothetical protein
LRFQGQNSKKRPFCGRKLERSFLKILYDLSGVCLLVSSKPSNRRPFSFHNLIYHPAGAFQDAPAYFFAYEEDFTMNDQNETAQFCFLEETAIRLRQNGFTVEPVRDHHLPVCWEKGRLCRISGKGSVLYRQECVDSVRAQDALQSVIDTAQMTSEYMAILETAPQLKATDLTGDYRILADFGDAVLAGHPTERGVQFVTWEWDFDREGVHHGHYFQDDYDAAKRDFTVRGGLVQKDALFEPEQLAQIYHALSFVREQDETLSFGRDQELKELMEQISGLLPADAPLQRDAPEQSGMTMK